MSKDSRKPGDRFQNMDASGRRIRDEIQHHMDEIEAQLTREGLTPAQAKAEARRRFGDANHVAAATRSVTPRRGSWRQALDVFRQDAAFALRQLRRQPMVTFLTLTTLVMGVAATAVIFSVVDAVVLAPLPFADPDRLVVVDQLSPQGRTYGVSEPNLVDFQNRNSSFVGVSGLGYGSPVLRTDEESTAISGMMVNHNFFSLLGIAPSLGRSFLPEEDLFEGATDVVMLSRNTWTQRFGEDPDIIGKTIILDGVSRQVVGVVPSDRAWAGIEVFTPIAPNPDFFRDDQRLQAVARLKPGVSLAAAQQDMEALARQLSDEYPESNDQWGSDVRTAREWLIGPQLTRLGTFLLGAVGLFLLMACASVSNLLLARATARVEEMSIRAAVGAGRRRIAAQLVTEGLILATVGTGLALMLAPMVLDLVRAVGPADIARLEEISLDGSVLGVASLAAFMTVMLAGLAPAALLLKGSVFGALRSGGRSGGSPGAGLRRGLLLAQFALAVTVLLCAGLLTKSFVGMQELELGFEPNGVARFAVRLPSDQYSSDDLISYLDQLSEELMALPGVQAVGATHAPPYSRFTPGNFVARSDQEPDRQQDFLPVSWRGVSEDYFDAAGISLFSGRTFRRSDRDGSVDNPPVVIDRALAETLWPNGENPVGQRITWFLPGGRQWEVIGVVATARDERIELIPRPRIYRPLLFTGWDQPSVLVRTSGNPADLIPGIRDAVRTVNPSIAAIAPDVLSQDLAASVAWPRFSMQVLSVFAFVALILAAMGIYGVTAFSVAQRRREIGVRIALGAEPSDVRGMVVRETMKLAAVGIATGVAISVVVTGFLESLLFEISATDPTTFLIVPLILLLVAMASAWIPARRALRVKPQEALRAD